MTDCKQETRQAITCTAKLSDVSGKKTEQRKRKEKNDKRKKTKKSKQPVDIPESVAPLPYFQKSSSFEIGCGQSI